MITAQFHHASIDKAFSRLAVSSEAMTVTATIGGVKKTWPMNSLSAARAALKTLQRQMFVSFESVAAACGACNAQDGQRTAQATKALVTA